MNSSDLSHRAVSVGYEAPRTPAAVHADPANARPLTESPRRGRPVTSAMVWELGGCLVSSAASVWLIFTLTGLSAPFGALVSWLLTSFVLYGVVNWRLHGPLVMKDRLATMALWVGALCALIPLMAVILYVVFKGLPVSMSRFPHFFVSDMSQLGNELGPNAKDNLVGTGAAIVGTVEQVGIAAALTVPLGLLTATFLADHTGLFARLVGSVVDATTGAPAIICGLFVYIVWVVPQKTNGKSGLAASMALAVMMLPIVTRAAQEVIAIVPGSLREAALALGAPRWRVIVQVVLPTARAGIATAVILGIARVAGETAPILFAAGGNNRFNWDPFHGFQDSLPLRIYELINQGKPALTTDAWGVSFVLVLVVVILFIFARRVGAARPGKRSVAARIMALRLPGPVRLDAEAPLPSSQRNGAS